LAPPASLGRLLRGGIRVSGLLLAVVVIGGVFTYLNSGFLTTTNLLELVRAMSSLAIVAIGETFVIMAGELDLSVGATYGVAAMLMAQMWIHGTPFYLALAAGLGIGILIGAVNAFLTTIVKIPSFVVTLGALNFVQGLTLLFSNAQGVDPAYVNPPVNAHDLTVFRDLGGSTLPGNVPIQVLWLLGVAIVAALLLHRSLFGFRLSAIGGNAAAARVAKLPIVRYKWIVFMISGLLAALAGILDFSFLGSTDPSAGIPLTFPVFAAVIIGGASLSGGRGTVIGTLTGALLLELLTNGLSILGVGPFAQLMLVGLATVSAVAVDRWTSKVST
jgi:ribose/xylose/arabinose/galactoside ABC-type transport system permease subunit